MAHAMGTAGAVVAPLDGGRVKSPAACPSASPTPPEFGAGSVLERPHARLIKRLDRASPVLTGRSEMVRRILKACEAARAGTDCGEFESLRGRRGGV
jgi:hypothetical protein